MEEEHKKEVDKLLKSLKTKDTEIEAKNQENELLKQELKHCKKTIETDKEILKREENRFEHFKSLQESLAKNVNEEVNLILQEKATFTQKLENSEEKYKKLEIEISRLNALLDESKRSKKDLNELYNQETSKVNEINEKNRQLSSEIKEKVKEKNQALQQI